MYTYTYTYSYIHVYYFIHKCYGSLISDNNSRNKLSSRYAGKADWQAKWERMRVFFVFLLALVILPTPVWLAPPPASPSASSEPFPQGTVLVHPKADNVPKVRQKKITLYQNPLYFVEIKFYLDISGAKTNNGWCFKWALISLNHSKLF